MDGKSLKVIAIACLVVCLVLIYVAVERYQTNANNVRAMNTIRQSGPFGSSGPLGNMEMKPAAPAATKYAVIGAVIFAGAAVACFILAGKATASVVTAEQSVNPVGNDIK